MPDLNQRLTALREEEVEKRSRFADLSTELATRALTEDESAEHAEIEARITQLDSEQKDIQRALNVGPFSPTSKDDIGLDEKEKRQFSLLKLVRAASGKASPQDIADAALELAASEAITKRDGASPKGVWIPNEIRGSWFPEQRDLTASVFASAGAFVNVDFQPQSLIELLRNSLAAMQAGVTVMDGLVGDVAIPKHTGTSTSGWVTSDGGTISESTQTAGQVTLTPRSLGTFTDWSRQLRLQSSVSVEQFVRQDLAASMALAIDVAIIHGTATSGQPLGVENVTGIGTQSFSTAAAPTRAEIIGMLTDLATANAFRGNLAFLAPSAVLGNLLNEATDAGSGQFVLDKLIGGNMLGLPVIMSNQIQAGEVYFGNWSEVVLGQWGGLDFLVDPFVGATAGNIRLLVFQSVDVAVRHAESFCKGSA